MYQIAICDDEKITCEKIRKCLDRFCELTDAEISIETFFLGNDFVERLEEKKFDIVFLDIELPDLSGVEIGRHIRAVCQNQKLQIVYISSKTHYALDLFKMRPLDFLVKPIGYEAVERVMKVFLELLGSGQEIFEYQSGQSFYRVPHEEILYFVSEGRQIRLIPVGKGDFPMFYGKMEQVLKQLDQDFLMIHKSFLINMRYIKQYNYESVVMVNGDELNISRPHRKEVRSKMMRLWRKLQ
ncbi:LytTR family DNA-binding domain-containing protein [Faecalicatena sp. AGMB00832]|uniref:LytTR family DNA-binding domain-containing protein n=1 Tax=Faecalicatena faecalis TaxID=2726362 RepID=A0ABS6CZ71_9FIRM|nr:MULTISPECIES: LytTR family DNA-binding domain-containing protein [Faecalicatena]MBU3874287.1 LytTR family DNA-binding domain-containing protein [Faecalicatena faecalis]MCI6464594.1 LytTR family DNA-binding domain-containing protein [Faecalicatena sp.]MDY5620914.1 LytTR family DNA-binding domain-containing protein [Lachnospiraceae bacterium]